MSETAPNRAAAPAKEPAKAVPATTILLLRPSRAGDAASPLEVFMVVRHHQIDFASGAIVFPGGKVEAADGDPRLRARCAGADGLDDEALAFRVGGIREAFEECGVLLARRRGESGLVPGAALGPLKARWQEKLAKDEATIVDMVEAEDLVLACDALVPYSHWITPVFVPRRFDTWFFLAVAPVDQLAEHDGGESVDSVWVRPADVLEDGEAGRRTMLFPTKLNLMQLAESATVDAAVAAHRGRVVPTILPKVERRGEQRILSVGRESGYKLYEIEMTPERPMAMKVDPASV